MAQLAHNLLVWFRDQFLAGTKTARAGRERLGKQILRIPGEVHWRWKRMAKAVINNYHPWANAFLQGVKNRFTSGGWI